MPARKANSRGILPLILGLLVGVLLLTPVSAHVTSKAGHNWNKHYKKLAKKLFYTKGESDSRFIDTGEQASDADTLDGRDSSSFAADYCGLVAANPASYPGGPCRGSRTPVDTAGFVGQYTSLALGADGLPIVSYYHAGSGDLKVVHCTTVSCSSFDPPVAPDTTGDVGTYTSMAVGTDGLPVVSYKDESNGDLKVVHCTSASCSTWDTPVALDTGGDVGQYTSVAVGVDGFPLVSYWDIGNGDLKVVHCTTASCSTWDAPVALDTAGAVGLHTSMAVGVDGFPVVSYQDFTNSDLKVVHCTTASCSTWDAPVAVDTAGNVGTYTSMAIGVDGLPVVSYQDLTNGDLKVVHCTTASCSTWDAPVAVDTAGNVGTYTSMAVGVDGLPVVSYKHEGDADLKLVHCTTASCSTWDTPVAVDTAGNVGTYSSLGVGVDGLPVMSYLDEVNDDLKVARVPVA